MPLHKTYKLVVKRLKEDGFAVEVEESRHYKVTYSKGDFEHTVILSKTPSSRSAIVKGIATFRRKLRERGYTTLDNFTARLMTEYEVSKIIDAAAENMNDALQGNNFDAAVECTEVLSAICSLNDKCFESDRASIAAHDSYLKKLAN